MLQLVRVALITLVLAPLATSFAAPPATNLVPHPDAVPNIHPPGDVDNAELVPFIVADPAALPGIVVDDTTAALVGQWQYSTHTPPYVGLGYLTDQKDGKGKKTATFTPVLPDDGFYEVRLAHCYNVRRATNTPVTIHHADGETMVRINQQETPRHDRLFRSLGTFRFKAGRTGWVRISTDGTAGKYVIADAVQWLPTAKMRRNVEPQRHKGHKEKKLRALCAFAVSCSYQIVIQVLAQRLPLAAAAAFIRRYLSER